MRTILIFLFSMILIAPAWAIRAPMPEAPAGPPPQLAIDVPLGWQLLPGLSNKLSATANDTTYFPSEPSKNAAIAYGRANRGALYLTWADSIRVTLSPETALRASFDAIHQAPYLASPEAGSTQEVSYRERSFDGLAELRFEWAHMSNGTVNIVRAIGWKDKDARVHLAIAECVLPNDMSSESRPLCESALDSLRLTKADHKPLAALPEPGPAGPQRSDDFEVPALETRDELPAPPASAALNAPPSQVGEVLYDGRNKSDSGSDNRIIIAIGVLLLAAAVYLTTRSRSNESDEDPGNAESGEDNDDAAQDAAENAEKREEQQE